MSIRSIRQLSVFLEVARLGSIRKAAESLGVSQPAVSSALGEIQREIGGALVARSGRGIVLTPAGLVLQERGRRAMALLTEASEIVAAAPAAAKIRIAAVTTAAESFMPELLRCFYLEHNDLEIELGVANRERVWDQLDHWEVELVIAGRPPTAPRLRTLAIRKNELVVVAARERPPARVGLENMNWLLREAGSGTRAASEELLASLGIAPSCLTVGSNGAIRECVRAGLGISLLSTDFVGAEVAAGKFAIVATAATPLARNWHLVTNAERVLSAGAHRFATYAIASKIFEIPPAANMIG